MSTSPHNDKTNGTVAAELVRWLKDHGIRHVFGTPSGPWLPYMEAMRTGGVDFILVSNEATAGFMASVYSWFTGAPGACYATIGPGATNLSTGVGAAYLNRSPVFAFTTEPSVSMLGRTVQMAIDQQTLYGPITKATFRLEADTVRSTMDKAYAIATSERPGPVHIGLPEDVGTKRAAPQQGTGATGKTPVTPAPSEAALTVMVKQFAAAKQPVLAIGLGAVRADAGDLIRRIAEKHNVPVVLTPMAKGLIQEDHPSYAGVLFHALSDRVAETHKQADLVVGIGYDPVEFNFESWMPEVPLVNIDTVPADIDQVQYPEVSNVIGAIEPALNRLLELSSIGSTWDMAALKKRTADMFAQFTPTADVFGPIAVLEILRKKLPADGIMTCDVGAHTHLIGQMWPTPARYTQIMDNGWSSMGFGVPSALGAKVGSPEKEVVCVTGDGGFLMMAGEMATAKRIGKRIVFILLSDRSLELINLKQQKKELDYYGVALYEKEDEPVYADSIFDVPVLRATDAASFEKALDDAFASDGPVIVQAIIDPADYGRVILRKHK
ncbi:MAG: thiamine pyrophosphate-binding protein [Alkalispirochaeta sp.]